MRAGATSASTPVWTSRDGWLSSLRTWAHSRALGALCAAERVSITAPTLLAIATVMAEHADHATGRHVAITRATIAERIGCDVRTVTAAWRVLRAAEWAVEAQRGHGSPGTPSAGRRPSVYHLISRRRVSDFHLPPSGGSNSLPPVRTHSPSAHPRPHKNLSTKPTRHWRTTPRPLPVQRLAAQLVARSHGLGQGHIGGICDTITAAGIDPNVWSAQQITNALNRDMRRCGWSWPNHIERPAAFLSSRLQRLDWTPHTPPDATTRQPSASTTATPTEHARAREAGRAALNGPGHAAARAQAARLTRRAAQRRTTAAAAQTAAIDTALRRARGGDPG